MKETKLIKRQLTKRRKNSLYEEKNYMPNAFAIVHTYHDLKNAEYEVLQRILSAANRIGVYAVVLDRDGRVLWAEPSLNISIGSILPDGVVDFVLAMHFESARVVDAYSYITLWQPIEFYHSFGYQASIDKMATYNDLISCASDLADAHGMNILTGLGRPPLNPLPQLFHSLPEPFLKPNIRSDSTLFYIGINWERVGRAKGRFHDTLVSLDNMELTDIYGPQLLHGVAPWAGFKTYRGELPFDGQAVKKAINRSGICLVLSSAAHKHAGIMSNRLFEGIAGGAAIIATPNKIIDKYFKDVAYIVDDTQGEGGLGQGIVEALREIRSNPEDAMRRIARGQEILAARCSVEKSLQTLFSDTPARIAHFESQFLADAAVSVVLTFYGTELGGLEKHLDQFRKQKRSRIIIYLVCDRGLAIKYSSELKAMNSGAVEALHVRPIDLYPTPATFDGEIVERARTGPAIGKILSEINTPYFAFSTAGDCVFSDHFASAAKLLEETPAAMAACSGMIRQSKGADLLETRSLDSARFVDLDSIILVRGEGQVGRFVYRRELITSSVEHLMFLLDGQEQSYFRLAGYLKGPLAQTSYATYVFDVVADRSIPDPIEPIEHQRQYIRDFFSRNPQWLDRLNKGVGIPEFVYAYSPGSAIRWQDYRIPYSVSQLLAYDTPALTRLGEKGLNYLRGGFSYAEDQGVWIEGERGIIDFTLSPFEKHQNEECEIVLVLEGRRSIETGRDQHATFTLNGMAIAYAAILPMETRVVLPIPIKIQESTKSFRLEITPDHSDLVYDAAGKVADNRRLSMLIRSIAVMKKSTGANVVFDIGKDYSCGNSALGGQALGKGFYKNEGDFAWIAGTKGIVQFRLDRPPQRKTKLRVGLIGRKLTHKDATALATFRVNGATVGVVDAPDGDGEVQLDLSAADMSSGVVELEVELDKAEAVYDATHRIVDSRLIAVALRSLGVHEAPSIFARTAKAKIGFSKVGRAMRRLLPRRK